MNRHSTAWKKVMVLVVLPVLAAFMFAGNSHAATAPATSVWSKTLTNSSDSTYSIYKALPLAKTTGYLTVGGVYSTEDSGAWVMKLGADGEIEAGYTYSGISIDKIHEVTDGFIAIGYSSDGYQGECTPGVDCPDDFVDCTPGVDCPGDETVFKPRKSYGLGTTIAMKLDQSGYVVWQKELSSDSGSSIEINDIKETATDKYSLSGTLYTMDSTAKILIIDVDATEDSYNPILTTTVNAVAVADGVDIAVETSAVKLTKDNGYIATGVVSDTSGTSDATFIAALKVKADGTIEWAKKYSLDDGSSLEFNSIAPTKDGYMATGQTIPADGSEYVNWLAKLDTSGTIKWVKTLQMLDTESTATVFSHGIREDADGGYITSAMVDDADAGTFTTVIVKLDSNGVVKWQNVLGSDSEQYFAEDIRPLKTGGYFVGGVLTTTESGTSTPWLAKLDNKGTTRCTSLTPTEILKTVSAGSPVQESITTSVSLQDESDVETITDVDTAYEGIEVDPTTLSDDGSCTQMSVTVDITSINIGAGSVKSVPAGINCKSTDGSCTSDSIFWPGSTVTLTATADKKTKSLFAGWYDSDGNKLTAPDDKKLNVYVLTVGIDDIANTIVAKFSKPVNITGNAKDAGGIKGISGVTVSVYIEDLDTGDLTLVAKGNTTVKGVFTIPVPAGEEDSSTTYTVIAAKTGITFVPSSQTVEVGSTDTALDSDFIGHVYSLSGKVLKTNASGEDRPAPKVKVKLMVDTGEVDEYGGPVYETRLSATTNSKGIYVFKKVVVGDYVIQASSGTGASMYIGEASVSADDFDSATEKDVVEVWDILVELMEM